MSFLQTEFFILSVKYGKDSFNFMVQKLKVEINFCCDVLKEFTNINYDPRQKKKKKSKILSFLQQASITSSMIKFQFLSKTFY